MTLGPIEMVVIGFPGSRFTGEMKEQGLLDDAEFAAMNAERRGL